MFAVGRREATPERRYPHYLLAVSTPLLTHRGVIYPWHPSSLRASATGVVAVEQTVSYRTELLAGDLISIHSRVLEVKNSSLRLTHETRNDESGEVAATTILVGVHIHSALRKSRPLPASVRERAAALINPTAIGASA